MSDGTKIEWADATWNPVRGCTRVSEGCRNCYAERVAARFSGPGEPYEGLAERGVKGPRWTGKVRFVESALLQPLRWKRPRRIFVNSMSDLFHESLPDAAIDRIFAVMALAPQHTFMVLTKRPERMRDYVDTASGRVADAVQLMRTDRRAVGPLPHLDPGARWWPLANVWLGVSVENQAAADERIPLLLATPAAKRFISAEPLLGEIDLTYAPWPADRPKFPDTHDLSDGRDALRQIEPGGSRIDWVIVGGESGTGARPMHPDWVRSLRDQCAAARVPFFFKQWGEWVPDTSLRPGIRCGLFPDGARFDRVSLRSDGARPTIMRRAGKTAAGAKIDGAEHRAFSEPLS